MTRDQLVARTAEAAGITKTQAGAALAAILNNITNSLKAGEKVNLVGFGIFSTAKRAAREGRNPSTRKPIRIPATTVAKFRPGKKLKEAVAKR